MKLLLIFALLSSLLLTSDAAATEHGTEVDEMRLKLDLLSERVQTLEDKIKTCFCVSDKDETLYKSEGELPFEAGITSVNEEDDIGKVSTRFTKRNTDRQEPSSKRAKQHFDFNQFINKIVQQQLKTALRCEENASLGAIECSLKPGAKGDKGD